MMGSVVMDDISRRVFISLVLMIAFFGFGCASSDAVQEKQKQIVQLRGRLKAAQRQNEAWQYQVESLSRRVPWSYGGRSGGRKQSHSRQNDDHKVSRGTEKKTPDVPPLSGEHLLYSNLIGSYRLDQHDEAERSLFLLLKAYPSSVHADNALFLLALSARRRGEPEQALRYLDQLIQNYPLGNKVSAALLEKGRLWRQLHKPQRAKRVWLAVIRKFPLSIEALEADRELEHI